MARTKIPYHLQKRTKTNSEALKRKWSDPEFREKMSQRKTARIKWGDPEWRAARTAAMISAMAIRAKGKEPNQFESRCYAFLNSLGVEYQEQHPIFDGVFTVVDAYIESLRMCIYFDAERWHAMMPKNSKKDAEKRAQLRELGYSVMVIRSDKWSRRICQSDLDQIRTALKG